MSTDYPCLLSSPGMNKDRGSPLTSVSKALVRATAFDTDVNGLPLSFIISWYEQKAVAILYSLLKLGIKDIHLGPSLPAFVTPNILDVLVKNYNLTPIGTPDGDLKKI